MLLLLVFFTQLVLFFFFFFFFPLSSVQTQGSSAEASTPYTVELRGAPLNFTEVSFVMELGMEAQGCFQCVTQHDLCRGI